MPNTPLNPNDYPIGNDPEWEKITPEFFQFKDAGQELIGRIGPSEEIKIDGVPTWKHSIETEDGIKTFLGGVALDSLLLGSITGTKVKLVFNGMKKPASGGREFKDFDLYKSRA